MLRITVLVSLRVSCRVPQRLKAPGYKNAGLQDEDFVAYGPIASPQGSIQPESTFAWAAWALSGESRLALGSAEKNFGALGLFRNPGSVSASFNCSHL